MYRVPGKYYTDFYTDSGGTALIKMKRNAPMPTVRGTTHKRPPLDPAMDPVTNPVAVIRQDGDAWETPFMVVYESYTGEKNNTIRGVDGWSDGETSVLKVDSDHGQQTIIQSFSKETYEKEKEFLAGHFGVISCRDNVSAYYWEEPEKIILRPVGGRLSFN